MHQKTQAVSVPTRGSGLYEITAHLLDFAEDVGAGEGLITAYCRHTSCSLLIQENADPDVRTDLERFFRKLVPEGMDWIVHTTEGPDDMPAHIKTALTQTSIAIPVVDGRVALGTWQGLYLFEHRRAPHTRTIVFHGLGER